MKFKQTFAAVALLASPAIMAGELTGNVGVVSDYVFRGLDQTGGAAVQGGVDYATDLGIYTGLWVTNSVAGGGNEADVYVGYGLKLGEFTLDTGVIYYAYSEDSEGVGAANTDYAEVYVGGAVGPLSLKVFYAPEFGADQDNVPSGDPDKNEMLYISVSATLNLNDTLSFVPQLGFSAGDGVKDAFGDEYNDYSLTAIKKLKDDLSVSLAIVGTDLDDFTAGAPTAGTSDNPKFVIGFKKNFKI